MLLLWHDGRVATVATAAAAVHDDDDDDDGYGDGDEDNSTYHVTQCTFNMVHATLS